MKPHITYELYIYGKSSKPSISWYCGEAYIVNNRRIYSGRPYYGKTPMGAYNAWKNSAYNIHPDECWVYN